MSQQPYSNQEPALSHAGYWQHIPQNFFTAPPPSNFASASPAYFGSPSRYGHFPPPTQTIITHVPPPSLSTARLDTSSQDSEWVKCWLQQRKDKQCNAGLKSPKVLKIGEAQELFAAAALCLQELQDLQDYLLANENSLSVNEWEKIVDDIEKKKIDLQAVTASLSHPTVSCSLKTAVRRRSSKRRSQQQCRTKQRRQQEQEAARRQARHLEIDEWRAKQREEVERNKRDAETRREADAVLGEVHQKQAEGRRWLQLLDGLSKLRELRARAAADRGLRPSQQEDSHFNKVIGELNRVWKAQLDEYAAEERALRVMLEEGEEEKRPVTKDNSSLSQWEQLLFGTSIQHANSEFLWHIRAHLSTRELINIRADWDQFLVRPGTPMASVPPTGWVVPVAPTSQQWAALLLKFRKKK